MGRSCRVLCFEGLPASFVQVAGRELAKEGATVFVCVLGSGDPSGPVRHVWENSVQPARPDLHLFILRARPGDADTEITSFVTELASRHGEIDLLFLSDEAGFRSGHRLARRLDRLRTGLTATVPGAVVRRV